MNKDKDMSDQEWDEITKGRDLPQAVVEPLTDERMQAALMAMLQCSASDLESYSVKLLANYEDDVRRIHSVLLSATPTASKAKEKVALSEIQDQLTRMLSSAAVLTDAKYVTGYQIKAGALHSILGTMQGAGFPVAIPLPQNSVAASKADTGETLKALKALYNAIDSCIDLTPEVMRQAHTAIRNAESATPSTKPVQAMSMWEQYAHEKENREQVSTIKAEPTGEQQ
jgi:hypothetical protein